MRARVALRRSGVAAVRVALCFALALHATSARAQWSATLSLESDERYRGVSLSDSQPNARWTVNYDGTHDWYGGASLSRAALVGRRFRPEATVYAGWAPSPTASGRTFEVGAVATGFAGISGYDFFQGYAAWLANGWSSRVYYAPNYYGRRLQVAYAELETQVAVQRQGRAFAHVGALVPLAGGEAGADRRRFDVRVGAGVAAGRWDVHAALTAVTPGGPYPAVFTGHRTALTVGGSVSF